MFLRTFLERSSQSAFREELDTTNRRFNARAPRDPETGSVIMELNFLAPTAGPTDYTSDLSATRKIETNRKKLRARVDDLKDELINIEEAYGIQTRWQVTDARYMETVQYIASRRYHKALGKLQRLVVQRLFELHKLNLARTGTSSAFTLAPALANRALVSRVQSAHLPREKPSEAVQDYPPCCHYLQHTRRGMLKADGRLEIRFSLLFPRTVFSSRRHAERYPGQALDPSRGT